jgi:hypothetical protein
MGKRFSIWVCAKSINSQNNKHLFDIDFTVFSTQTVLNTSRSLINIDFNVNDR